MNSDVKKHVLCNKRMSLNEICYEQIKNNFWFGLFGDFKLIIDKNTNYFNATKLCQSSGKRFKNWQRLESSKELISYIKSSAQIRADGNKFGGSDLSHQNITYNINSKGTNKLDLLISGTYVSEDLILAISIWISPDFYIKCNNIISDYFIQDFKQYKDDNEKLQSRVKEIEESMEKLADENRQLKPIAAPYTKEEKLKNCFYVCLKNTEESQQYPYYVIRIQKKNLRRAFKNLELKYPNFKIIYKKEEDPNSIKLFNLMVEELKIKRNRNEFSTSFSEDELKEKIYNIYERILKEN